MLMLSIFIRRTDTEIKSTGKHVYLHEAYTPVAEADNTQIHKYTYSTMMTGGQCYEEK